VGVLRDSPSGKGRALCHPGTKNEGLVKWRQLYHILSHIPGLDVTVLSSASYRKDALISVSIFHICYYLLIFIIIMFTASYHTRTLRPASSECNDCWYYRV